MPFEVGCLLRKDHCPLLLLPATVSVAVLFGYRFRQVAININKFKIQWVVKGIENNNNNNKILLE